MFKFVLALRPMVALDAGIIAAKENPSIGNAYVIRSIPDPPSQMPSTAPGAVSSRSVDIRAPKVLESAGIVDRTTRDPNRWGQGNTGNRGCRAGG
jgi:hypothetical protein